MIAAAILGVIGVVAVVGLRIPGAVVALVFCLFGIKQVLQLTWSPASTFSWLPNLIVGLAAVVAIAVATTKERQLRPAGNAKAQVLVIAYCALFYLSFLWSPYDEAGAFVRTTFPYFMLCVIIVPLLLRRESDVRVGIAATLWLSVPLALLYLQYARSEGISRDQARLVLTIVGQFGEESLSNPLAIADLGAICGIAAFFWKPRYRRRLWVARVMTILALASGVVVVTLASRGELVAFTFAIGVAVLARSRRLGDAWKPLFALGFLSLGGVLIWYILPLYVVDSVTYRWGRLDAAITDRLVLIERMLDAFFQDPTQWLFGLGANYSYMTLNGTYPHNAPIQALTETGIVGLCLWLSLVVVTFRRGRFLMLRTSSGESQVAFALFVYFLSVGMKRGSVFDAFLFMTVLLVERMWEIYQDGIQPVFRPALQG